MLKRISFSWPFQLLAISGFPALFLAACSAQTQEGEVMRSIEPLRNLNASPQKAYDIRIVLKEPPGPFAEIDAAAQYDVVNPGECGEPQPVSGAIPRISTNEVVELQRISDTEFTGRVFVDRVLDEDYYGRGVCRWQFVEARVSFRESSDPMASWFVAALKAAAIEAGASKKTFFWSGHYPKAQIDNYVTFGSESRDHVSDAEKPEFFEVEISAQQAQL
ncbi:hypothetical protein LDO26_17620 [Luteimonas sp. BDR2-5]|uniref:hypothetical protein n=1 Tax=Proluteimonas luteida TaxID=2878685 RepID=UPI001E52A81C|nr:hypothetical protein [Luteimonas sp. BDR2-5]MCD9030012.1 hypothetical protein [Luteimonas sp. BDR2-5]